MAYFEGKLAVFPGIIVATLTASSFLAFRQNKAEKVLNFSFKIAWSFLIYVLNFATHYTTM